MVRMTAIVWMLSVCMPETLLAGVAFEAGEIDSSAVKPGSYVEIIYGRGEWDPVSGEWERLDTARGYIQAVDAERLIIGEQFWKNWKIAYSDIDTLAVAKHQRDIQGRKDSRIKSRRGASEFIQAKAERIHHAF